MTIAWPVGVPLGALANTYTEKPERNVATFTPPNAQERERNRATIRTWAIGFTSKLSSAEFDELLTFYRDTVRELLPFTREHPRTAATCKFKFTEEPRIAGTKGDSYLVPIKLRLLPS